jgi:innexin
MDTVKIYFKSFTPKNEVDHIDRLNYNVTGWILFIYSLFVFAKQYGGEPIQCWVPAEFKDWWEQYAENYCYVENTYYVPKNDEIYTNNEERDDKEISYYQVRAEVNC